MNHREFLDKVDEQLQKMSEQEKADWIHELARKQSDCQWADFLNSFEGAVGTAGSAGTTEAAVEGQSGQLAKINEFLTKIEEEEIYFEGEEMECDDDECWDPDYETVYSDPFGIGVGLADAFQTAENLVTDKQYGKAAELLERLCTITVWIDGEYTDYEPLELDDMLKEHLIAVNIKKAVLNLLYAQYQCLSGKKRAKQLLRFFALEICDGVRFEEMLTVGPEELKDIDTFMKDWVAVLEEADGDRVGELLTEACLYIGGAEQLHAEAARVCGRQPMLYEKLCNLYREENRLEECETAGLEALEAIPEKLVLRGRIADIAAEAALLQGHMDTAHGAMKAAFFSRSSLDHFLKLFELPDSKEAVKSAAEYAGALPGRRTNIRYWKYGAKPKQFEENELTTCEKAVIRFFHMEFEQVCDNCEKEERVLGWSNHDSISGVATPLFLLMMNRQNTFSKAGRILIEDIKSRIDFEEKDGSEFADCFLQWKKRVHLTEDQFAAYNAWLKNMIDQRVEAVVGGLHRHSYHKAAEIIVTYGEMLESNGCPGEKERQIEYYRGLHFRKSAFKSELYQIR